jgi:hypothetical protein
MDKSSWLGVGFQEQCKDVITWLTSAPEHPEI